ncbi:MAG: anthranilate synthase component I family protein [Deltaproteobacteria bacterium]|jgi:anthranilate synthase component 1|nr:anthranilate synthase component I family protein [Deltaproteobacteria bacterium]
MLTFSQRAAVLDGDLETPVGLFLRLAGDLPGILLESAEVDGRWGRYSIIGTDFLLSASCREGLLEVRAADERLASLRDLTGRPFLQGLRELLPAPRIEGAPGQAPITRALYGLVGYGIAGVFEPKSALVLPPREAEACLALPGSLLVFDHGYNRITRLDLFLDGKPVHALPPARAPAEYPPNDAPPLAEQAGHTRAAMQVKELIRQGEAIQVVLSVPFSAPLTESPFSLYRRLRRVNPSPYMFYMRLPDAQAGVVLGASPEVLVTCEADRLRLCPIAGTRPRSRRPEEDILFGDELQQDPKEKAEHVMLVDLGRNDLGRIARPGSVQLERFMEVERFSHVMHLTSRIQAQLAPGLDALDVLAATFPAGTVSGAPKVRAMEIIAEQERSPRGPYAGAVGWIGLDKDAVHLDFGIAIRSLWVRGGRVHWQAGAGIVHDSVPEKEWMECCAKAAVIRQVVMGEDA